MRLKSFSAPTVSEAMSQVRREMGPDAIIVSTQTGGRGRGVRVTAAIEPAPPAEERGPAAGPGPAVRRVLEGHDLGAWLTDRLVEALESRRNGAEAGDGSEGALATALGALFRFAPLDALERDARVMLVGPPGAGKTVALAKLAARMVLAGRRPLIVSADTLKTGGAEQLTALAAALDLECRRAGSPQALAALTMSGRRDAREDGGGPVLVDSFGANPFLAEDTRALAAYVDAARAEPVLVIPAGLDAHDTVAMAAAFARLGCRRAIITRVDVAMRFKGPLVAADEAGIALAEVSATPRILDGLAPLGALALARLMIEKARPLLAGDWEHEGEYR